MSNLPLSFSSPAVDPANTAIGALVANEAVSQLFSFEVDLFVPVKQPLEFDKLLGQPATVSLALPDGGERYFDGVCVRLAENEHDNEFLHYRVSLAPKIWVLTRRARSRIFQQKSTPDILHEVFAGYDVRYKLSRNYHSRDYCTQYNESDFNFASRLMEEEGIYYSFEHAKGKHTLVLADAPGPHPKLPAPSDLKYTTSFGGNMPEDGRVYSWRKVQEVRAGKYTVWDHCFELPHKNLEAVKEIQDTVAVGSMKHKLKLSLNSDVEIYEFPGEYALRFDGVDPSGGDRAHDVQHVYEENRQTAELTMQQEGVLGLATSGSSSYRHLSPGYAFSLTGHPTANDQYFLTSVHHMIQQGNRFRSGGDTFTHRNSFYAVPEALPYRAPSTHEKPRVEGTQTAVVVGPPGEEIATDKYGRVKVQFHWDRDGHRNLQSSCWIRVASSASNKQFGFIRIPRVGEEVIVDFLEGDPDNPIIIGTVYNAEMMPPYKLPDHRTQSGIKTRSTPGGGDANFNELRFEDKKGQEHVYFHAEKDFQRTVENEDRLLVGNNRTVVVSKGDLKTTVQHGKSVLEASESIELKVGGNSIVIDKKGVRIKGLTASMSGEVLTQVNGLVTQLTGTLTEVTGKAELKTGPNDTKDAAPPPGGPDTLVGFDLKTATVLR